MSNLIENIPYELFSYIGGGIFLFIILYKFFPKLFVKVHKPIFFYNRYSFTFIRIRRYSDSRLANNCIYIDCSLGFFKMFGKVYFMA